MTSGDPLAHRVGYFVEMPAEEMVGRGDKNNASGLCGFGMKGLNEPFEMSFRRVLITLSLDQ